MAYFSVAYQLNKSKDYQTLWDELDRLKAHRALNSFWLVDCDSRSAKALRQHMVKFIDADDWLLVAELTKRPSTHLCRVGTRAWLDARFGPEA